jgi:ornithine carbamoyltransferase
VTEHFLTVADLSPARLEALLDEADRLKIDRRWRADLSDRSIGLLFEKPSTRTRVSFEVAVRDLGAHPVVLSGAELQLGRGETVEDTARVLSRYLATLAVRTFSQDRLERLASASTIPIVNLLSDFAHPCQALADLQTIREAKGSLRGVALGYVGDGNNVAHSLIEAGALTGMHVTVATPPGYGPDPAVVAAAGGSVTLTDDPMAAAKGADVLYTDVWASMGQEAEQAQRAAAFASYALTPELLGVADPDAIVLHCLPAHRGEEIAAEVLDGPQSRVWDQAENRLHTQKALLLQLLAS